MMIVYVSTARIPSDRANSIQVMKVCQAMTQLGHKICLLVPQDPSAASSEARTWTFLSKHYGLNVQFPIEWLPLPGFWKRRGYNWSALQRARKFEADLIYTRSIPAAVFALLMRLPVALEIHNQPGGWFGPLWFRLFTWIPGKKRILPLTQVLWESLKRKFHPSLEPDQVMISPSGVDLEQYRNLPAPETARRRLGIASGHTVVCTGHLYSGRGTDLFLELAARFPGTNFLWVGGRPEEVQSLQENIGKDGLKNITFAGFVPHAEIPLYQAAADVLVLPYQVTASDGSGEVIGNVFSPMKQFEYLAAGRAIVASDLPAVREILNEEFSVLCPAGDFQAWSDALDALLKDPRRRNALGRRAKREALRYSWVERTRRSLEGLVE